MRERGCAFTPAPKSLSSRLAVMGLNSVKRLFKWLLNAAGSVDSRRDQGVRGRIKEKEASREAKAG